MQTVRLKIIDSSYINKQNWEQKLQEEQNSLFKFQYNYLALPNNKARSKAEQNFLN